MRNTYIKEAAKAAHQIAILAKHKLAYANSVEAIPRS